MIRITTAGAATATSYPMTFEVVEKLSKNYCVNSVIQPVVTNTFKVANTELVGNTMYATIQDVITVVYQPKNCNCNNNIITNTFVESFEISFAGADATSSISLTEVDGYTDSAYLNCSNCNVASGIRSTGTITATFTA